MNTRDQGLVKRMYVTFFLLPVNFQRLQAIFGGNKWCWTANFTGYQLKRRALLFHIERYGSGLLVGIIQALDIDMKLFNTEKRNEHLPMTMCPSIFSKIKRAWLLSLSDSAVSIPSSHALRMAYRSKRSS